LKAPAVTRLPFPHPCQMPPNPTHPLLHQLRLLLVALQFLTRVPVPGWVCEGFQAGWLNTCVRYFPVVGALVGCVGAAVLWAALVFWPPQVAALLAVAVTVWLTGAFHEDGLADTLDALGGYVPRERALAIMKDSRIGTYGAAALVLSLGLRVALLGSLAAVDPLGAALALVAAHVVGRTAAVMVMAWLPYAGDAEHAKAKPLATAVDAASVQWAAVWGLALLAGLALADASVGLADGQAGDLSLLDGMSMRWLWVLAATAGVVWAMRRWLTQRLGGYTGDALGATEQFTEMAVLLVLASRT
jgi:adenosylcobinamide-GDP ribazoletransferase